MDGPLFDDNHLPLELDARVRSELRDGERLLWVGQPRPGRIARQGIPLLLFGIPWTGFAVFWMAAASGLLFGGGKGGPGGVFSLCFPLFGLPFVLLGFAMLSSPFWLWRKAKRTCYALTDHRAIIWQPGSWSGVETRSYGPDVLGKTLRIEYGDGSGDLVFEEVTTVREGRRSQRSSTTKYGFLAIPNVRGIEELMRKVLLPE